MKELAKRANRALSRSAARLAAVQALYQMDMTGIDLNLVIQEFQSHRLGKDIEGSELCEAEAEFFRDLVQGVVREQRRIDPLVDQHIDEGWRLNRVDSILRAILRAGAYEVLMRPDVPSRVAPTESLELPPALFKAKT